MLSLIKRRDNDSLLNHVKEGEIGGGQEEHKSGTSDLYSDSDSLRNRHQIRQQSCCIFGHLINMSSEGEVFTDFQNYKVRIMSYEYCPMLW